MPVPLGASLSDPKFVFVQIVYVSCVFFIILGIVRVILGVFSIILFESTATSLPVSTLLSYCFHIPLRSLFKVKMKDPADGSTSRFILMHLLTAVLMSIPLAFTIQRRKFALDFAFTLYTIYFIFCCLIEWRVWGGFGWWLGVIIAFSVLYTMTSILCRRRELQDIFFSPLTSSPVPAPINNTTTTHNNNNNNNNNNNTTTTSVPITAISSGRGDITIINTMNNNNNNNNNNNINSNSGSGVGASSPLGISGEVLGITEVELSRRTPSPALFSEAVLMGPGSASKRRRQV